MLNIMDQILNYLLIVLLFYIVFNYIHNTILKLQQYQIMKKRIDNLEAQIKYLLNLTEKILQNLQNWKDENDEDEEWKNN